ncbi:MAG: hypothetical protein ABI593_08740 [Betaproteobacteria bacterium]
MKSERGLDERISTVERKLELRRERTVRHLQELRAGVGSASRWLPLIAAGGALGVGILAARRRTVLSTTGTAVRRTGWLAAAIAMAGTAIRVAMSPQARVLWSAWRDNRRPAGR